MCGYQVGQSRQKIIDRGQQLHPDNHRPLLPLFREGQVPTHRQCFPHIHLSLLRLRISHRLYFQKEGENSTGKHPNNDLGDVQVAHEIEQRAQIGQHLLHAGQEDFKWSF